MTRTAIPIALSALLAAGCSDQAATPGEPAHTNAMQEMQHMPAAGEHVARGTVNSIDRDAGTIDVSHEAVESLSWPAMTMQFHLADSQIASDIAQGEEIEFRFTTAEGGTITAIEPIR